MTTNPLTRLRHFITNSYELEDIRVLCLDAVIPPRERSLFSPEK